MEPIDYVGALRRSWRLLVLLAIVGAVIAVLPVVSTHAKKGNGLKWQASALVGSAPKGSGSIIGGGVSSQQIQFYARACRLQQVVFKAAGQTSGVPVAPVPHGHHHGGRERAGPSALRHRCH